MTERPDVRRRRWRPRALLLTLLAALVPLGAAQTTITFWPSSNPEEIAFANAIVTRWNADNPDLQIRMQPLPASRSTEEVLLAAIAARTTPDVAANIYPGAISQYVEAGGLYQHDSLPGFTEFMVARSGEDVLRLYTHPSGHVYQIPWKSNPVLFAYNVDLLAEAGIEPEQLATYSGFLEAARTVHEHWGGEKYLYAPPSTSPGGSASSTSTRCTSRPPRARRCSTSRAG